MSVINQVGIKAVSFFSKPFNVSKSAKKIMSSLDLVSTDTFVSGNRSGLIECLNQPKFTVTKGCGYVHKRKEPQFYRKFC